MIIFLNLITNETIELENWEVDIIEYSKEGIVVKSIEGQSYLTEIIELQ